jgi:hypothetical protein
MKWASKKVGLSFICERVPATLQPKIHLLGSHDPPSATTASLAAQCFPALL